MIKISIFDGWCWCVTEGSADPAMTLRDLVAQDLFWEIDYSQATAEEHQEWSACDIAMKVTLIFNRDEPLRFLGEVYDSVESFWQAWVQHPEIFAGTVQKRQELWEFCPEWLC